MQRETGSLTVIQPLDWAEPFLSIPTDTSEAQAATLGWSAEMNPGPGARQTHRLRANIQMRGSKHCCLYPLHWQHSSVQARQPSPTHASTHCRQGLLLASCMPGATWLRGKKGWMLSCSGWSQSQRTIPTPFYLLNCGSPWTFLMKILTDSFTGSWKSSRTERRLMSCSFLPVYLRPASSADPPATQRKGLAQPKAKHSDTCFSKNIGAADACIQTAQNLEEWLCHPTNKKNLSV